MTKAETSEGRVSIATRLLRLALIFGVSAGLTALGLALTGHERKAWAAWERATTAGLALAPMSGSVTAVPQSVQGVGGQERMQECRVRHAVSTVIGHYEAQAKARAVKLGERAPYVKMQAGAMEVLAWVEASGQRVGVAAWPLIQGEETRYLLFEGGASIAPQRLAQAAATEMPLGVRLPEGSRALFDWRGDVEAAGLYEVPGEPADVLAGLEPRLAAAGCEVDLSGRAALSARAAPGAMVTVPLRKGARKGTLMLRSGAQPGATEVSLVVRGE